MKKLSLLFLICVSAGMAAQGQWQQTSAPTTTAINCVYSFGPAIIAGTADSGIYFSTDEGVTWVARNSGVSNLNIKAVSSDSSGTLYAGSKSRILFSSSDTGMTWTARNVNGTGSAISSVAAYGPYVFAGQVNDGVFRSADSGVVWQEVGLCCASVLSLCSNSNGYMFAGTITSIYNANGTFASWNQINNGFPATSVRALYSTANLVFAGTYGNGIYLTADDGANWSPVNTGLGSLQVISFTGTDTRIIAGTDGAGVFLSLDQGLNWISVNDGLPYFTITALAVSNNVVYAGTIDGGVWKRPLSEFTRVDEITNANHIEIFPNPANEHLIIRSNLTNPATARLEIYTVYGQLIHSSLLEGDLNKVALDRVQNGMYLVKIISENFTEEQTIIVQK